MEWLLIVQIMFANKEPARHQMQMPDMQTCLHEAENFLDKYQPPEGAQAIAAGCAKKIAREEKS